MLKCKQCERRKKQRLKLKKLTTQMQKQFYQAVGIQVAFKKPKSLIKKKGRN